MRFEFAIRTNRSGTLNSLIELSGILVTLLLLGSVGSRYVLANRDKPEWTATVIWLAGTGLLGVQIATSHAAAEPGLMPVLATAAHWLGVIAWGGAAMHLAIPGRTLLGNQADVVSVGKRYLRLSLGAAIVTGISGAVLGFIHVHNPDALATRRLATGGRGNSSTHGHPW